MGVRFPNESTEYRAARDRLLEMEKALRRLTEEVAVARRALPPGGVVPEDYVFQGVRADGSHGDVRLSELFSEGKDSLVILNVMYSPAMATPCPACSGFLDALDGAAEHAGQRINLAVVALSPLPRILAWAEERGWRRLRFLSSAHNAYNRDYHGESEAGEQHPMRNVFHRHGGVIRHASGSELLFAEPEPDQDPRHNDTFDVLYNLFDLTPDGRGDFRSKLRYD